MEVKRHEFYSSRPSPGVRVYGFQHQLSRLQEKGKFVHQGEEARLSVRPDFPHPPFLHITSADIIDYVVRTKRSRVAWRLESGRWRLGDGDGNHVILPPPTIKELCTTRLFLPGYPVPTKLNRPKAPLPVLLFSFPSPSPRSILLLARTQLQVSYPHLTSCTTT